VSGQQQLRLTIPDRGPGRRFAFECDYCGKVELVQWNGDSVVCDKCLGVFEQGEGESELDRRRR
jgi:hypothetical protein